MTVLSHGSDLTLAPTLGPLVRSSDLTIRAAFTAISQQGFQSVQLDATLPGIRPRELSARARRDLAATAQRSGLAIAGIDLFIPRQHLLDAEHIDRATQALQQAIVFAGDLGRVPLSIALALADLPQDVSQLLLNETETHGISLIVHAEDEREKLADWTSSTAQGIVGIGVDPAVLLASGQDPEEVLIQAGKSLCQARLSDTQRGLADGSRLPVGQGDLNVSRYRLSADLATHRVGPIILDLRGLSDPAAAATTAQAAWDNAAVAF